MISAALRPAFVKTKPVTQDDGPRPFNYDTSGLLRGEDAHAVVGRFAHYLM